jgi:hypothetical protein
MGESDYLYDKLIQKPFSGKEIYIYFLYSLGANSYTVRIQIYDEILIENSYPR